MVLFWSDIRYTFFRYRTEVHLGQKLLEYRSEIWLKNGIFWSKIVYCKGFKNRVAHSHPKHSILGSSGCSPLDHLCVFLF